MEDCIYRKEAIDDLKDILNGPNCPLFVAAEVEQVLEEIPFVRICILLILRFYSRIWQLLF